MNLDLFPFSVLFTTLEIPKSSQPEERFSFLRQCDTIHCTSVWQSDFLLQLLNDLLHC